MCYDNPNTTTVLKKGQKWLGQTEPLLSNFRAIQCLKGKKIIDLEISGKLDKMQYNGMSCQTKLIMLFNQVIDFCFSDKEKTVNLHFLK